MKEAPGLAAPDARPVAQPRPQRDGGAPRSLPHIDLPLPTTLRGADGSGERFELETALESLSTAELVLRLERSVDVGAELFVVVWLTIGGREPHTPGVALRGAVLSATVRTDGEWAVVLRLRQHRFLYTGVA
jgi:hypothetical protein